MSFRDLRSVRRGLAVIILGITAGMWLAGCNAVQGAGEDIQEIGEAGERAIKGQ